ncbi:uncharacterized protein [Clytia hemisphaerica]|uniref:Fork-head domain-containing protein n=1 Tax=Clytia hemisphaerica TaxID=252671 RepID=A0A7M5XI88_9CNID|eukprot:TCONS_00025951-protein
MATSKTEEIALRLWKLKSSTLELDIMRKYPAANAMRAPSSDDDVSMSDVSPVSEIPSRKPMFPGRGRCQSNTGGCQSPTSSIEEEASSRSTRKSSETQQGKKEDVKPTQSYIALIATAILKSKDKRLVLSDIYKYILDNYSYFQSQDKSWRNSIRHNLSLNECFIKVGRSEQGKGHYWAIHPANYDDFSQGDFRRRRARRRVRRSFMDTHPYTGYPLRPYSGISRPAQGYTERELSEYPASRYLHDEPTTMYRSQFYRTQKPNFDSLFTCWKYQPSKYQTFDKVKIDKKPINAVSPRTAPSMNEDEMQVPSPTTLKRQSPKSAAFSIENILGNKLKSNNENSQTKKETIKNKMNSMYSFPFYQPVRGLPMETRDLDLYLPKRLSHSV